MSAVPVVSVSFYLKGRCNVAAPYEEVLENRKEIVFYVAYRKDF